MNRFERYNVTMEMKDFDENNEKEIYIDLPAAVDYLDMEKQYKQLMYLHEAAIQQIGAKLNILKGEFEFSNDRNPIASISSRIKSKESILYKMQRKGLPMTVSALLLNIHDIAGVRVTCPFIEDVYYVARMLGNQRDIQILDVKDYIHDPKPNGYRSLHLIVTTEVHFAEFSRKIPVEIQIRTIAMDFWASLEHKIYYKFEGNAPEYISRDLRECAEIVSNLDAKMLQLNRAILETKEQQESLKE